MSPPPPSTAARRLSEWCALYWPKLTLYARQWLSAAEAEDVVQDVFLKLVASADEPERPAPWLFAAVRNAALSHRRSSSRAARRERAAAGSRPPWFDAQRDDAIDARAAEAALAELPPEQREVIVLRLWGGLTLAEAARVLGERSTSTLFSRYRAGLERLREILEPRSCETTNPECH